MKLIAGPQLFADGYVWQEAVSFIAD